MSLIRASTSLTLIVRTSSLDYNSMSESQFSSTIINLQVALEESIKDARDFMTVEFRSNQAEMKNQLNEMQSKLEFLMTRVKEVEERVSDIEDKLMARRETEEKRDKQKTMRIG